MYLDIFKALIVKWIALKKMDAITSTPSVTNLEEYMEQQAETPQRQLKQEPEDIQVPRGIQPESS